MALSSTQAPRDARSDTEHRREEEAHIKDRQDDPHALRPLAGGDRPTC